MNEDERLRHQDLLVRLCAVSQRVMRGEADQRVLVELLQDFRDLVRLLATRLRALDGEVDRMRVWLLPVAGRSERIERHLRN